MRHIWSAAALVTALWIGVADARYTCDVVARRGDLDPDGFAFTNKFEEQTGVNAAGDVTFIARAGNLQQALYRYPNVGASSVIARVGDPAPGGSAFTRFGASCFGTPSMNTAGTVAFVARLAIPGQGVFVDVGGTLEKAAQTTDASPGGGTFVDFPSVSEINDAGQVAFNANVSGGPSGIFLYDSTLNTLVTILDTSDTDSTARPFCAFEDVGLSNTNIAFVATVGNPTCATPLQGVFNGPTGVPIAVVGDASPIGGSNYIEFSEAPEPGPVAVTFQAKVAGVYTGVGIFSTAGPSKVVAAGDAAPDVLGAVKKLGVQHRQDGGGDVITRLFLRQTTAKHGIFRYDATPEAAVVKTDAPPMPPFGAGSKFRAISDASAAGTGTTIAFRAKMKDTTKPGSKTGVLSCVP
jgi:hypothetical protein